jgi:hypothetical protein
MQRLAQTMLLLSAAGTAAAVPAWCVRRQLRLRLLLLLLLLLLLGR